MVLSPAFSTRQAASGHDQPRGGGGGGRAAAAAARIRRPPDLPSPFLARALLCHPSPPPRPRSAGPGTAPDPRAALCPEPAIGELGAERWGAVGDRNGGGGLGEGEGGKGVHGGEGRGEGA